MRALTLFKKTFIFTILSFLVKPALAQTFIEIPILLKVSQKSPQLSQSFFQENIFPDAEACLNEGFSNAGASLRIKLSVLKMEVLSEKEEMGIVSENIETEFHRIGDRPAFKPQGNKAPYIEAIFSGRTKTAHVPPVLTKTLLEYYESGAAQKQAELLAGIGDLCNKYYPECDLTVPEKISHPQLKKIALDLKKIAKKYHVEHPGISNSIYLDSQFYINIPSSSAGVPADFYPSRQFAHEMMHAWGGLSDRYYFGADTHNLMSGFACAFDDEQIRSILKYRGISAQ